MIRVRFLRQRHEFGFELIRINPRSARLSESCKIIHHDDGKAQALKLSPQEQVVAAFGFFTLKPPSCRASRKAHSLPVTYNALLGSTTTLIPADSTRMSRLAGASCRSILYCRPEHSPPTTAPRSTPFARPCFASREETFLAAVGLTLISRSSPIRKPGVLALLLALAEIISGL